MYFKERNINCDYADVSGKTFNFTKWRFQKRGLNIEMYNVLGNSILYDYQAIIAYDVLEHLWDIPRTIKKISEILVSGGYLISKSTFSGGGIHLKKNEKYQDIKVFNNFLSDNGFEYLGRLKISRFNQFINAIFFKEQFFLSG